MLQLNLVVKESFILNKLTGLTGDFMMLFLVRNYYVWMFRHQNFYVPGLLDTWTFIRLDFFAPRLLCAKGKKFFSKLFF